MNKRWKFLQVFYPITLSDSRLFALVLDTRDYSENTAPPLRLVNFGEETTPLQWLWQLYNRKGLEHEFLEELES